MTQSLKPYTRGVLEGTVQGRAGLTPFAAWSARFGLWPLALAGALVLAGAVAAGRRRSLRRDAARDATRAT